MSRLGFVKVLIFFILLSSCKKEPIKEVVLDESTKAMKQQLYDIAMNHDNINLWHLNKQRAMAMDAKLKDSKDPGQFIGLLFRSALEWLNAGDFDASIARLDKIFSVTQQQNVRLPPKAYYDIKEVLGVAYLRKAEVENCVNNHNEYSCLLPIDKKGQHTLRDPGEKALKIFRDLLEKPEATIQTKWLYNLTFMTLGGYPEKVEKQYLMDPSIFKSEIDFPRFNEIGTSIGIGVNDIAGGVVMDDFNNDGFLDLMVSSYGLDDQLKLFINNGKNGFEDATESANLLGLWSGLNIIQADYNNDGWLDVFILRGAWLGNDGNHPNSLLKNNGDGTFSDVTKKSGLYSLFPTQTASWGDYNNDGWIDLFIGNEHSNNVNAASQLYENKGDGTFVEVANRQGVAINGFVKGCVWGDYNNDSYPDLYLSLIDGQNYLLKNEGPDKNYVFTNNAVETKTTEPFASFPCWFFDYNQDGWEDIFVSGFDFRQFETAAGEVAKDYLNLPVKATLPRLYRNDQNGKFTEVSAESNVDKVLYTMGCNFGDLNNDGNPDFYAATGTPDFRALVPNRMFLNDNGKRFLDVTTSGGFGHLQKGHGVAFGDLDSDGDQDVYNVLGGSYDGDNFMNALFLNPGNDKSWIKLKLQGTVSNKSAIGARVEIQAVNNEGELKAFYNTVSSGGSFGANPLLVEQGLGDYDTIKSVEITWPGQREVQVFKNIQTKKSYIITEGEAVAQERRLKTVVFQENAHEHHHH